MKLEISKIYNAYYFIDIFELKIKIKVDYIVFFGKAIVNAA